MVGCRSTSRKSAERTCASRCSLFVSIDARSMVAVTVESSGSGAVTTCPPNERNRPRTLLTIMCRTVNDTMLSCLSSRSFDPFRGRWGLAGVEQVVDLAGEVALEAPNRLQLAVPERGAFRDVGLRLRVHPQAADDGEVQGAVGLPVAAWLSRCRRVCPDEAGSGATPQSIANAGSLRSAAGCRRR